MSDLELKIKRITIAAESRGIRINQNRLKRKIRKLRDKSRELVEAKTIAAFNSLDSHRRNEVRNEARAMHLACNFLRGRDYRSIEPISYWDGMGGREMNWLPSFEEQWKNLWERVRYHVERHLLPGEKNKGLDEFVAWEDDAKAYASNPHMQQPALDMARARSIDAKNVRRKIWQLKQQKVG